MRINLKRLMAGMCLLVFTAAELAATGSEPVAVLDFSVSSTASNHWSWAEGGVPDLLQLKLQQLGATLLDRDLVHAVINEQRLAANGLTAKDCLHMAQLMNAQYLITGRVVPLAGGRFRVEAAVFSVEAIETVATGAGEGEFPGELSPVLQNVARQLIKKIQRPGTPTTISHPDDPARKPEALIMFYRGLNACSAGQPELATAYFMNATSLDPDFRAPLLWEIKAYELAGFHQLAAIRREAMADTLKSLGVEMPSVSDSTARTNGLVLAVLNPVVTGTKTDGALKPATLSATLGEALLSSGRVRLFAFENIGAAVAEQDLRLSSFFASENAPRYGRWLAADALLVSRASGANSGTMTLDLALVNPLTATIMTRVSRTGPTNALPKLAREAVTALLKQWTNRVPASLDISSAAEAPSTPAEPGEGELRPVYQGLVTALRQARREPEKSDSHRALANALAATGRPQLAAYEIEQCLQRLDIQAPHADTTYLGTHRWLFWEPSPASGAVGLVNRQLIEQMIEQLLANHPKTLAAGCMRYNLAVSAWQAKNWSEAITQAQLSRQILQPMIERYNRNEKTGANRGDLECEMAAATYFLEGSSLCQSDKSEEAKMVFHRGLDFIQSFTVRDFCLPLGPYIGDFFGPERVYGYGGDPPGIPTRIKQELAKLKDNYGLTLDMGKAHNARDTIPKTSALAADTDSGSAWLDKGERAFQQAHYRQALGCYQAAVARNIPPAQCSSLNATLVEVALDQNLSHPYEEAEKLRRELGLLPGGVSWVEWFAAGRKYQISRQFDLEKAVACYRSMIHFLETPEAGGFFHLEKEPRAERINLRWGPSLGEVDLLWTQNYDSRWYSAAFYLAQCLIATDQKEEAAEWLRRIALKVGGDSAIPLLEKSDWHSSSWSSVSLGVRAAQMLQELHEDSGQPKFGEADGPYKLPRPGHKASLVKLPPLPAPNPQILNALTNVLTATARETRRDYSKGELQVFIAQYGHDAVPALLSLLPDAGRIWNESALAWMLEQIATSSDASWLVPACREHWQLIGLAYRLDPGATAMALAEEWQAQLAPGFVRPGLIMEIVRAKVRPLYPLILQSIAEKRVNHFPTAVSMDRVVREEKSDELEAGFRVALGRCLTAKLEQNDGYELARISQLALRHGVPEAIAGLLRAEGATPAQLLNDVRPYMNLPADDAAALALLHANSGEWIWNAENKQFSPRSTGLSDQ